MNWKELRPQLDQLLAEKRTLKDTLSTSCLLLNQLPHWDWVGYYIAQPSSRTLHLGPYLGAPTDHTVIPYGRGICGQVAESEETYISDDVRQEGNYIACSISVRSELVAPIMVNGKFVAQLDIDSSALANFSKLDQEQAESFLRDLAQAFPISQWESLLTS